MCGHPNRRDFLTTMGAATAVGIPSVFRVPKWADLDQGRPYLDAALEAWRWIDASRIETASGVTWPADPLAPDRLGVTLYTDATGVVPFALELFHITQEENYLAAAAAAVDHILGQIDDLDAAGLYTGLAGVGFVAAELARVTGRDEHRVNVERVLDRLVGNQKRLGDGVAWPFRSGDGSIESNDIISGTAGTALGLLYLHDQWGDERALNAAVGAGRRLLGRAIDTDAGIRWDMWPGYAREMPNFSHGTAGIAYTLVTLHERTGAPAFLDAAVKAARYLQSIATMQHGGYRIYHHKPDGEDLFYLSWCHGPVGTNRLFKRLHRVTADAEWGDWIHRGARGIMQSGIPERRTPGFWENISQCCGDAGVGEFMLTSYRESGKAEYKAFAERITADILRRETRVDGGRMWTQAEHRVRPELLVAQTGLMQGAAGVGKYLLHVDRMSTEGAGPAVRLPDQFAD